jgi:hypothetical protein
MHGISPAHCVIKKNYKGARMEKNQALASFSTAIADVIQQFQLKLATTVPSLLAAISILIGGWLIALLLRFLVQRLIANLDRLIPSKTVKTALSQVNAKKSASDMISKVVFWTVIFFTLTVATEVVGLKVITSWMGQFTNYLPNVIAAVLMGFVGVIAASIVQDISLRTLLSAEVTNAKAISKILQGAVILVTLAVIAGQIGIDIYFLNNIVIIILASLLGGCALAFGLGSRSIVNNILSAHYLQKKYEVGQVVKISGIEGKITEITPTSVIVDATEGEIMIPAKEFSEVISIRKKGG